MSSNSNALLSGLLLTGFCFVALWWLFSALIFLSMMFAGWVEFFRPTPWYDTLLIACGAAVLAFFSLRTAMLDRLPPIAMKSRR